MSGYERSQKDRLKREKGPKRQNWLTSTELAARIGVSSRQFRRLQHKGYIPAPDKRTVSGWGLWSPDQVRAIIRKRAAL